MITWTACSTNVSLITQPSKIIKWSHHFLAIVWKLRYADILVHKINFYQDIYTLMLNEHIFCTVFFLIYYIQLI